MSAVTTRTLADQVQAVLEPLIAAADPAVYVVEVRVLQGRRKALEVLADADGGIRIDQCARITRQLREALEGVTTPLDFDAYELELGSPGVGAPLRLPRQYRANVGRELEVTLADGSRRAGRLTDATDTHLTLEYIRKNPETRKKETVNDVLPLAEVSKAVVQVSFKQADPS